jgi:hypothetical protein
MHADGLEIETAPAHRELDVLATSRILRDTFGFPALRPGQDEVVAAVLSGADVLAVMPAGARFLYGPTFLGYAQALVEAISPAQVLSAALAGVADHCGSPSRFLIVGSLVGELSLKP